MPIRGESYFLKNTIKPKLSSFWRYNLNSRELTFETSSEKLI